jgi:hypothetical protein
MITKANERSFGMTTLILLLVLEHTLSFYRILQAPDSKPKYGLYGVY